jgi:hypothetical protein
VDIGFSKQLLGAKGQEKKGFLGKINNMWVSLEVFNLLNINNTITHTWIQSVDGRQYSIPDYLTPRRYNLKLIAWFSPNGATTEVALVREPPNRCRRPGTPLPSAPP